MLSNVVQNIGKVKEVHNDDAFLTKIEALDASLFNHFSKAFIIDEGLARKYVSFQANKNRTYYRWYKYKEAFSADLVEYLFCKYNVNKGKIPSYLSLLQDYSRSIVSVRCGEAMPEQVAARASNIRYGTCSDHGDAFYQPEVSIPSLPPMNQCASAIHRQYSGPERDERCGKEIVNESDRCGVLVL